MNLRTSAITLLAMVVFLGACASGARIGDPVDFPPPPPLPPIPEVQGDMFPNSEYSSGAGGRPVYRVWYGTNRQPTTARDGSPGFSGERDDTLHYGTAIVSVPESHKFGSIGSSWWTRLRTGTDDRLVVDYIVPRTDGDFFSFMNSKLGSRDPGKRTALVYIHGYNTTFEEAAIRAAQIGYDLKVEGVTAFFSWPSKGETYQYAADEAAVGASEPFLEEFLGRILRESGAEQVNVIAHSMGNRGLLRVLETMSSDPTVSFGQIILAAPDVDTQMFLNLAGVYPRLSTRTTMYVSSKDLALRGSGVVHDYPRAGFQPPVTVVDGINTIEVSGIDLTVLGHRYFAEAKEVLYDMFQVLQQDVAPDRRIRLTRATNSVGRRYHRIRD